MKDFLKENGIEFFGIIPLERCKILKEYLLLKNGFDKSHNAITMLLPYRTECLPKNLSVYASVPDYHGFVEELSKRLDQYTKQSTHRVNSSFFPTILQLTRCTQPVSPVLALLETMVF